jgi:hypothetical protein
MKLDATSDIEPTAVELPLRLRAVLDLRPLRYEI